MRHRLPGHSLQPGDDAWFHRLNCFEQQETRRQAEFKASHWSDFDDGQWAGGPEHTYPHILPKDRADENLYPEARQEVVAYLDRKGIARHREFANLRSSQVCCLNFLFPLRMHLAAAAPAMQPLLPNVAQVNCIEFEYTGPDGATCWLGEPPGGKRGQNRTSADAAIWWADVEGGSRLTLIEWKYTERQFGTCGGFASDGNKRKERCRTRADVASPHWDCYLVSGDSDRTKRRYWDRLRDAGIILTPYTGDKCPFAGPLYQLMRLQLLAAYCVRQGEGTELDVVTVHFRGNTAMEDPPKELNDLGSTVTEAWQRMLHHPHSFRVCFADDLATAIREGQAHPGLAEYLSERYGV